jgi:hypothetical protein
MRPKSELEKKKNKMNFQTIFIFVFGITGFFWIRFVRNYADTCRALCSDPVQMNAV